MRKIICVPLCLFVAKPAWGQLWQIRNPLRVRERCSSTAWSMFLTGLNKSNPCASLTASN